MSLQPRPQSRPAAGRGRTAPRPGSRPGPDGVLAAGRLAGQTMIVSGGAGAIGRSVAVKAATEGARVLLVDRVAGVEAVAAECRQLSAHRHPARAWVGDAADPDLTAEVVADAVAAGRLDSVVLAAGSPDVGHLGSVTPSGVTTSMADNLHPQLALCRELMRASGPRRWLGPAGTSVVFVISKHAVSPGTGFGAYPLAKAAQLQLMRMLAQEGAPVGLRANAVNPGAVFEGSGFWTDELVALKATDHGMSGADLEQYYRARNLLRHRVVPEDVAEAALFLAGPGSRATTGAVLPVDGGLTATFSR